MNDRQDKVLAQDDDHGDDLGHKSSGVNFRRDRPEPSLVDMAL